MRLIPVAGLLIGLVTLAGCDTVGNPLEVLSAKRPGPDEFQVLARKELRMPGDMRPETLPAPRPGAPSPLEHDPQADAIAALTGGTAPAPAARISRGEASLLTAARARAADPVEAELLKLRTEEAEADQPYEPPTILELFGAGSSEIDPDLRLDARAEAERLQKAGVRAPSDPNAVARLPGEDPLDFGSSSVDLEYDTRFTGGRPNNTVSPGPEPVFE